MAGEKYDPTVKEVWDTIPREHQIIIKEYIEKGHYQLEVYKLTHGVLNEDQTKVVYFLSGMARERR